MADIGLPALLAPPAPQAPQVPQTPQPPVQHVEPPIPLDQPVPTQPIQYMPQLNWSNFKPEFTGKP